VGAGKRVLEVGCGFGTDSWNFARAGAQLTAVKLSTESLDIAEQRADVMGVADRIRFVHANAEALTVALKGEPRDLVYVRRHPSHAAAGPRAGRDACPDCARRHAVKLIVYQRLAGDALGDAQDRCAPGQETEVTTRVWRSRSAIPI
jgi:SAM-dependent methyltransferase